MAEEALQDVFLKIWQNAGSFAPGAGTAMGWLVSITRNRAIDIVRTKNPAAPAERENADYLANIADLSGGEGHLMDLAALRRCLATLEEPARNAILLAYYEGYSREDPRRPLPPACRHDQDLAASQPRDPQILPGRRDMTAETDMQAAEYVLGTLSAAERHAFEALLLSDPTAREAMDAWQRMLAPLDAMSGETEPPARVWQAIAQTLPAAPAAQPSPALLLLRRSRDRWRRGAVVLGAVAAGLVAFSVNRILNVPEEAKGSYVAVVNRPGDQPALIIRVDLATRTVFVRPVATAVPQGRSLELWYIGNGLPPRSMGLVDKTERDIALPEGARIEKANFAVTVEPQGGSPSGAPTGPIVYSGQLFKE